MAYWDTSCLLKLYAPEADSIDFEAYVLGGATIVTSGIARFELHAALQRKEAAGDLRSGGARQAISAYDADVAHGRISVKMIDSVVAQEFDAIVEQCYRRQPPISLRTLDAIHISTAGAVAESIVVATDRRLREAAFSLDFPSIQPPKKPAIEPLGQ